MKKYPAIACVEFSDIAVGMYATDAMLKKAPISLIKCGTISHGRYLTLIGGSTASVNESLREGLAWGGGSVIDSTFLPDVHRNVHDAVLGARRPCGSGALAVIETPTVSCNIEAAERALKGTPVELVELRLAESHLAGKGVSIYQGELHDIEAAMDIALAFLQDRKVAFSHRILTAPHEAMAAQVEASTLFHAAQGLELEGETA